MASLNLRSINADFETIRRRLREEHGPGCTSNTEISKTLADVDKDLEECDAEVIRLQKEIHHLQARIIHIQNQRQQLEHYKNCLQCLRMPMRRFPNEILLRIFDLACDMNIIPSKLQAMPALAISHVSSRWRNLAISYPDLWSRICIITDGLDHYSWARVFQLYLDSSQQSFLTLEYIGNTQDLVSDALTVHGVHKDRFKELTIIPLIPIVIDGKGKCYPNLHRLSLLFEMHTDSFILLESPCKLNTLELVQYGPEMKVVFEICSNLKELHFRQPRSFGSFQGCAPLTAPLVETLSVSLNQPIHPNSEKLANVLFASITCPSLTSLLIEADGYTHTWPQNDLHAFIARSSFHLTTLSIKSTALPVVDLLYHLPSLLNLTVDDTHLSPEQSPITSDLMQSMHAFSYISSSEFTVIPSVLVPNLQSLVLRGSENMGNFEDRDFVEMVSSRWFPASEYGFGDTSGLNSVTGGVACLRSVVMDFRNRKIADEEVYKPLKHLEEAGMRVVVIGENYRL